jgi:kynurenine 3-monooxygenase
LLINQCRPYDVEGKVVIVGDAAHAMVPFYGQGMNCGFEDMLVLDHLFSTHVVPHLTPTPTQLQTILSEYTTLRNPDVEAMCDLALYNYTEMRNDVVHPRYLFRKKLEGWLHCWFPKSVIPLYTMVSFSRIPYKQALDRFRNQTIYFDIAYGIYKWGSLVALTSLILYKLPSIRSSLTKLVE